ncbi:phosphate acetyltransferase [Treponema sp. OMZ 792]|uniref:phosphate acetyltransferase n=1 Tax=unclassified Treponema TaxID=2638727 RepID=UPI0020A2D632|nr:MULTISPECIES: phosphate acetyltransferase [unclassified Treponema]UTC75148.1 phosphate acetyltransferase [Treponema sp. OMZ 792]UTC76511.1 phosphate acetyltransferase [Treponema sp. OMZ 799]UTC81544.1 phosphate acetyltransferase [Treponema sp. OMZ 798]
MSFVDEMKKKAKEYANRLVLPEGTEERTLKAARSIVDEKLVSELFLIGSDEAVSAAASKAGVRLDGIKVIDPKKSEWLDSFAESYYEKRKAKGMTLEQAKIDMSAELGFAAMMLVQDKADAMVAGALNTTADVLRAGLKVIGTLPGMKTASSCFLMDTKNPKLGANGVFIFSDCAVIPTPSSEQLADIACSAAMSCRTFAGVEPVVAMLSFSTKGSGGDKDENILRVREAVKILEERKPDFVFDGEIQLDCAIVPSVMQKKAADSPVKGQANTLIFPDLGAGNIGYKLVQRIAGAEALGPFLQGFAKPISDLSRGCSVDDIITTSAVTLVQAGRK